MTMYLSIIELNGTFVHRQNNNKRGKSLEEGRTTKDPLSHTHTPHTPHTGGGPCFYYVRVRVYSASNDSTDTTQDGMLSSTDSIDTPSPTDPCHQGPIYGHTIHLDKHRTHQQAHHTSKHTPAASTHQQQAHQQAHQPGTNEEEDGVGVEGGREARSHIGPYKYIIP